ncbi:MAG: sulfatase [Armatimonadota bacterium]|nr:sulfatase [Armatimonadota bacterium]
MSKEITRREFIRNGLGAAAAIGAVSSLQGIPAMAAKPHRKPNIIFVFADQMRYEELGCGGNSIIRTPNMDKLASQGVHFTNAISGFPVCSPYRAMLLTGRYGQSNGVVSNGVLLPKTENTIAEELKRYGYTTGYVGKWHLDGPIQIRVPKWRRQGFDYWVSENCRHDYFDCPTWFSDGEKEGVLPGYQPVAQTDLAIRYIKEHKDNPFCLFLSWGPPHVPNVAPDEYINMYKPADIKQSPNVEGDYRGIIAKCYGQVTSIDDQVGRLMKTLDDAGIAEDTILVFSSDHGDMLMSHGQLQKQRPWEEAIHIPFILRYPRRVKPGRKTDVLLNSVDVMPTLLSLAGSPAPSNVEGTDLSAFALGKKGKEPKSVLLQDILPCGQAVQTGIAEWRGVRTKRYTYARWRDKGWVLYDNKENPHQLNNLIDKPEAKKLQDEMEAELQSWLKKTKDDFATAEVWKERVLNSHRA